MSSAPSQLRFEGPLADLVASTLRALADEARRIIELGGCAPSRLRHAHRELAHRAGVAEQAHPTVLLRSLAPLFNAVSPLPARYELDAADADFWRDVARFGRDLLYIRLLSGGGLPAINAQLAERLAALHAVAPSSPDAPAVAAELNDVLHRAIFVMPHLATGLTLEIESDDAAAAAEIERYIGRSRANRRELTNLWQAAGEPRSGTRWVVTLPLPYVFTADAPQSQRRAERESWEDLAFVARRRVPRDDVRGRAARELESLQVELPPLAIIRTAYDRDVGVSRAAVLLAREIVRLEFTVGRPLLPAFSATRDHSDPQPRTDALTHYLLFRDFGDVGCNPRLARTLDVGRLADCSLFEPSFSTGLLDIAEDDSGRQWLERGFGYLALLGRGHPAPALLRFEGVEIRAPQLRVHEQISHLQSTLYRAALGAEDPVRRFAKEIRAGAVFGELVRHPVAPRRFRER